MYRSLDEQINNNLTTDPEYTTGFGENVAAAFPLAIAQNPYTRMFRSEKGKRNSEMRKWLSDNPGLVDVNKYKSLNPITDEIDTDYDLLRYDLNRNHGTSFPSDEDIKNSQREDVFQLEEENMKVARKASLAGIAGQIAGAGLPEAYSLHNWVGGGTIGALSKLSTIQKLVAVAGEGLLAATQSEIHMSDYREYLDLEYSDIQMAVNIAASGLMGAGVAGAAAGLSGANWGNLFRRAAKQADEADGPGLEYKADEVEAFGDNEVDMPAHASNERVSHKTLENDGNPKYATSEVESFRNVADAEINTRYQAEFKTPDEAGEIPDIKTKYNEDVANIVKSVDDNDIIIKAMTDCT